MTDIKVTQAPVYALASAENLHVNLTQAFVYSLNSLPASEINITQSAIYVAGSGTTPVRVTGAYLYALTKVTTGAAKVRAWGFTLDGHEFYVLRLGDTQTLVYDRTTRKWARWQSAGQSVLRTHLGLNWQGFSANQIVDEEGLPRYTWNIVGGDDSSGMLWMVDPEQGVDENLVSGETGFSRRAVSVLVSRARRKVPVNFVHLTASLGNPSITGATVTLHTSDDQGSTWINHGSLEVDPGNMSQELLWSSLGLVGAPGRIFDIRDTGASIRLSSLDAEVPE
jgi:hypothetical protein